MKLWMLLAAFNCAPTLIYNPSKYPWNAHDDFVKSEASIRCQQLFKESPCLSRLVKVEYNTYHAYCGKEKNE